LVAGAPPKESLRFTYNVWGQGSFPLSASRFFAKRVRFLPYLRLTLNPLHAPSVGMWCGLPVWVVGLGGFMRIELAFFWVAVGLCVAKPAVACECQIEVKVCSSYQANQFFECSELQSLDAGFSAFQMHAVVRVSWVSDDVSSRVSEKLYLMWTYNDENGVRLLSNPNVKSDYSFSPRVNNNPSWWRVSQTAWFDHPGVYTFYVYDDPLDPEGSVRVRKDIVVHN